MSENVSVYGIDIQPKVIYTAVGRTESVTASVYPMDATNKGVQWVVKDKTIIKSNGDGTFTALKAGETTVTVVSDDGGYTKEARFVVANEDDIEVNKITFYSSSGHGIGITKYYLGYGESFTLRARCISNYGLNADRQGVTWTSSNPDVASVVSAGTKGSYSDGKITAGNTSGTITITAASVASPDTKAEFTIIVQPTVKHVKKIQIQPRSLELAWGQKYQVEVAFTPSDATNKDITWSVPIGANASVSNGLVYGIKKGKSRIIAYSIDGDTDDYIVVNVIDSINPVTNVTVDKPCLVMEMDGGNEHHYYSSVAYVPTLPGQKATDADLTVSIANPEVVEVREITESSEGSNRRVIHWTCVSPGYTVATIRSKSEPSKYTTVELMVLPFKSGGKNVVLPYKIFTVPDTIEVERGQVFTLWARGFGGPHTSKDYSRTGYLEFYVIDFEGGWVFTPNCTQLEPLRVTGDTQQNYAWFRAGYIPGDYEIKVTRKDIYTDHLKYGEKIVKVKIVDKLFDDERAELIPKTYYLTFTDDDNGKLDIYQKNPYEFYLGWIREATSSTEKPVRFSMDDIDWKISHDGIISKIERDGKFLRIYRGPNYGLTQIIFYLKSNPHIYYPCFAEHDGGDWRYYTTDKNLPPTVTSAPMSTSTSSTGSIYPTSSPLIDDQTGEAGTSSSALPLVYKTSERNTNYNYNSDTGLAAGYVEPKKIRRVSRGSNLYIDPNVKGKKGSS